MFIKFGIPKKFVLYNSEKFIVVIEWASKAFGCSRMMVYRLVRQNFAGSFWSRAKLSLGKTNVTSQS